MAKAKHYIEVATRENTKKTYAQAVKHFEVEWGGMLPTTPEIFGEYLSFYADKLAFSTLKNRQAAISEWHEQHGFPNPTKNAYIKKILKGIFREHGAKQKQVDPISIDELKILSQFLDNEILISHESEDQKSFLTALRNRAIVSLSFWQAFRPNEIININVENISFKNSSLQIFIKETKNTRSMKGANFYLPEISLLCPVNATKDWVLNSELTSGPLFRKIDRYGNISNEGMNVGSISPLVKRILSDSGLEERSAYTFRRGFATWAAESGWSVKDLMEHVKWKDRSSAERYIESIIGEKMLKIENSISQSLPQKN